MTTVPQKFTIPIDNQLSWRSIPRNVDLKYQITNHCNFPSKTLVVDWHGYCFVCACEAWLPITVGKIESFQKLSDIWHSDVARAIQTDINQKKYSHCAVDRCGILNGDRIQDPYYISINIDPSCNLKCPSCRKDSIMYTRGPEFEEKLAQVNHLMHLIEEFEEPCHIVMSGNGDPLASNIMRPLVHDFRIRDNHTVRLFTNGLLLKKQLPKSSIVKNITQYFISIDAGSAQVYERVRLGGQFANLLENFEYLRSVVDETGAEVLLKFVLQQANYLDMQNFIDLCNRFGFDGVINRLEDWGTWDDFQREDVIGNSSHPDHTAAISELKQIYSRYSTTIQFNPSLADIAIK